MTRDDIIRMARDAGWHDELLGVSFTVPLLERFHAIAVAAEREACAKYVAESFGKELVSGQDVADAIRARGNT